MKRILSMTIALALVLSFATTAFATEGGEQPQEETPVVVSTLEELQAAVTAAEGGDTIAVSAEIMLDGVALETDKDITLVRADTYESGSFFRIKNGALISGFTIENYKSSTTVVCESSAEIEDCCFIGDSDSSETFIKLYALSTSNVVCISDSSFSGAAYSAIYSKNNVQLTITDCTFSDNRSYTQGGAIRSEGKLILDGCTINDNYAVSGGGVYCSGELTITDCQFSGNQIQNEKFGTDILSFGTLSITDDPQDGAGYYEESTGVKVELPLADYASTAKLIYLTDEQAAEYFSPEEPDNSDDTEDNEQNGGEDNSNPDEPENPAETPSEPPEQPDNGDDGDTPAEPEEPQDTPDSGDDSDDDYEPPVYRPVRPTKPVEPEPQPEPAPTMKCNEAVIDTSRSVVLLGYGDGSLHEDDPLTRAQLATIVYRLLDDDSIAQYDTDGAAQFKDVAADAWYYRYVQTINRAGIVLGVGEGNYAPNGLVTWAQTITILSRFVEPQDCELQHIQYDGWAVDAVQTAVALGWIEDSAEFNPDAIISRGQLVDLVNSVLAMYR
ncbi:MAG: S-layer homology domain-containing protein [Acutalibacteraceae bacterium]